MHVTAVPTAGGIRVTWTPVTANPPVTHYLVHAGQGSCPITVPGSKHTAVLPVMPGQRTITPVVDAVNAYGMSERGAGPTVQFRGTPSRRFANLQILQLSDFHGALQAAPTAMGAAVLETAWQRDRARVPATITVSSGDSIGGSPPVSGLFEEFPTITALNLMGMDVAGFGNHEHDRPLEHVRRITDASRFPWVASNYSTLTPLEGKRRNVHDSVMLERGGVSIGVVGMNTEDTAEVVPSRNLIDAATGKTVKISASTAGVQRAIDRVRSQGADVVVVLAHQGWSQNVNGRAEGRLISVAEQLRGADVVFGGHTHQQYTSYVKDTFVAQVPNSGFEYSRTQLCVDTQTRSVVGAETEDVTVDETAHLKPDRALQAFVDRTVARMQQQLDVRVGVVSDVFPRGGTPPVERSQETPMGTFAAETLRRIYGTQFAFISGGGIRDTLPAGKYVPADATLRRPVAGSSGPYDVTLGDVTAVFPFGNSVATTSITGADLWKALENGVSRYPSDGRFPQIAGFRFAFDPNRPVGQRVTEVTLADGTPLRPDDTKYSIATVDFMIYGGDGYTDVFRPLEATIRGPLLDDIIAALKGDLANGTVTRMPEADGRIRIIGG